MRRIILPLSAVLAICGCDFGSQPIKERQLKLEEEKVAVQKKETENNERNSMADGLKTYLSGKATLAKQDYEAAKEKTRAVRADRETIATLIAAGMAERDADGKERPLAERMLGTMRNQELNALARKYTGGDFMVLSGEFELNAKETERQQEKYEEALKKNREMYEQNLEETKKWTGYNKERRDAEAKRLREDVARLEREYNRLKGRMVSVQSEQREYSLKIKDVESELFTKRRQLDQLRGPKSEQTLQQRTLSDAQRAQLNASHNKDREEAIIERRLKPKRSVADLVKEYGEKTFGALQKAVKAKVDAMEAAEAKEQKRYRGYEEMMLEVAISDLSALKKLKEKVDKLDK